MCTLYSGDPISEGFPKVEYKMSRQIHPCPSE